MKIKKNNCPKIDKVKFACDNPLSNKLTSYEMVNDHLNKYNTTLFVGTQGSGKTSLLVNFVNKIYKKVFHKIIVFMPTTSRNSLKPNIFEKLPAEQTYEELNYQNITEVYEKVKMWSEEDKKTLIIYDDVQSALKQKPVLLALKHIIANQRHLHVVNLILCQNYFALDKSLREIVNNVVLFKLGKSQMEKTYNELIEVDNDKFSFVRSIVFNEPYSWLFVNLNSQRLYRQFDEILLDDDNEREDDNENQMENKN